MDVEQRGTAGAAISLFAMIRGVVRLQMGSMAFRKWEDGSFLAACVGWSWDGLFFELCADPWEL